MDYLEKYAAVSIVVAAMFCGVAKGQTNTASLSCQISFFNAMKVSDPLFVSWSGVNAFPDGLTSGQSAGPLSIPAVASEVAVSLEGSLPAKAAVSPGPDSKITLIFYLGAAEPDKETGEMRQKAKIFQTAPVPTVTQPKFEWPIIYLGEAESVQIDVNGVPVALPRAKSVVVGKGERYIRVSRADKELAAISVDEPADCLFVVYGPPDDLSAGIVYR